jgi:ring-1,2-phenylacetyl-CoA epoxidase subunit PaaC
VIRLGDGTAESKSRMIKAIEELWPYTGEMFITADYEIAFGIDSAALKNIWEEKVKMIFDTATLPVPEKVFMQTGGKQGTHTEHLGYILAELQYVQRAYPNSNW